MCVGFRGLGHVPALLGAVMFSAIVVTYLVAALNGHVEAFFPYISDTGVELPESCIFSQFFNLAAFLGVVTMYLRYKLIQGLTGDANPLIRRLSKVNLVFACFSCLGLSMVANFQETKIEVAHLTGAMLVFGLGVVYALIDAFITFKMCPEYNGRVIYMARFAVGLLGLISLFTSIIAGTISRNQWAANIPSHSRLHWLPTDPDMSGPGQGRGYTLHLLSTFGEWSVAASFLFYYITFIRDFSRFSLKVSAVLYASHLDESPTYPTDLDTGMGTSPRGLIAPGEQTPLLIT